jgi:hypothetical protein
MRRRSAEGRAGDGKAQGFEAIRPRNDRKTRSVPTDNGLRGHYNESLLPSGPERSRQNPEDPIEHR